MASAKWAALRWRLPKCTRRASWWTPTERCLKVSKFRSPRHFHCRTLLSSPSLVWVFMEAVQHLPRLHIPLPARFWLQLELSSHHLHSDIWPSYQRRIFWLHPSSSNRLRSSLAPSRRCQMSARPLESGWLSSHMLVRLGLPQPCLKARVKRSSTTGAKLGPDLICLWRTLKWSSPSCSHRSALERMTPALTCKLPGQTWCFHGLSTKLFRSGVGSLRQSVPWVSAQSMVRGKYRRSVPHLRYPTNVSKHQLEDRQGSESPSQSEARSKFSCNTLVGKPLAQLHLSIGHLRKESATFHQPHIGVDHPFLSRLAGYLDRPARASILS